MSTTEIAPQQTGIQLRAPGDEGISDKTLSDYGKILQFDDKYLRQANAVGKKVMDALKASQTKPQRFSVSESHVCQEGVDETGIDIVAFVNESSDVNKVRTEYNEVLNKHGASKMSMDDIGVMHFDMDQVHVNLGVSPSKGPTMGEHRRAVFQQTTRLDQQGNLHKNEIERVSVDLHDSMTDFLTKGTFGDDFTLAARRLARAWRRTTGISDWFGPVDAMMVMQKALNDEKALSGVSGRRMKNVMRRFFTDLSNLQNMALTFPEMSAYDWNMVPSWIQQERPLLLDPVNPWRNTFSGIQTSGLRELENHAKQALEILNKDNAKMSELFRVTAGQGIRGA